MKSPLERMRELIPTLPKKDAKLAERFLKERNFVEILELVESDIQKASRRVSRSEGSPDNNIASLTALRGEVLDYMSYLDIPEDLGDYDYY